MDRSSSVKSTGSGRDFNDAAGSFAFQLSRAATTACRPRSMSDCGRDEPHPVSSPSNRRKQSKRVIATTRMKRAPRRGGEQPLRGRSPGRWLPCQRRWGTSQ